MVEAGGLGTPQHQRTSETREKGRQAHGKSFLKEVGLEHSVAGGRGLWTPYSSGTGGLGPDCRGLGPASALALGPQARLLASVLGGKTERALHRIVVRMK